MNDVIVKDEKAKVAVRALNREYGTGRGVGLDAVALTMCSLPPAVTQDHLKRMMLAFESIDVDESGSIDVSELFEYLQEARTTFTDALFALMGEPLPLP